MRWLALGVDYEMAGKDLIDSVKLSGRDLPRARRHVPPEGLQLRTVPRREGPEDFEVKGQRTHHRGMAALREPREPVAVHVPRAEGREAALLRRHPASGRRISAVPRRRIQRQDGQQRLINPVWHIHSGTPPKADMPISFSMLLTLGVVVERRECRDAVGLHRPLSTRRHAHDPSQAQRAVELRDPLFPRFRAAGEEVSPASRTRRSGRRYSICATRSRNLPANATAEQIQDVVYEVGRREPFLDHKQEGQGRQARRVARLVQHALPGAARPGERAALRVVRRGLWATEHRRHDRRCAGALDR